MFALGLLVASCDLVCGAFITPKQCDDRLGNQLLRHAKTMALARQFGMTCLRRPFPDSDKFMLCAQESCPEPVANYFDKIVNISRVDHLEKAEANRHKSRKKRVLYVSYMLPLYRERIWGDGIPREQEFLQEVRQQLSLREPIELPELLQDYTTVALHVRTGGGFDSAEIIQNRPDKFVDPRRAITFLRCIAAESQSPLYVYIFTDDHDPSHIAKMLNELVNDARVVFDYRKSGNAHDQNVIEDLFFMAKFDYLVRPGTSTFSLVAELLGDHKKVFVYESENADPKRLKGCSKPRSGRCKVARKEGKIANSTPSSARATGGGVRLPFQNQGGRQPRASVVRVRRCEKSSRRVVAHR